MEKHSPALIIGAGPTGLALACWLHKHGIKARIIDKKPEATKTSNALGIQARTLEILNDLGLADEFIKAGNKVRGANIHIAGKSVATIDLDNIASIYPYALILPQAKTETLLTQYLQTNGIEIERDCELTQIERQADGYHVKLKKTNDRYEQAACDWIVGCDGAHSKLRNLANIKFLGDDIDQPFIIADVDMATHLDSKHIHTFFTPETALALFPINDKTWRIVSNAKQGYDKKLTPEFIAELVEKRSNSNFLAENTSWTSSFWIHSKVVSSMQGNHLFLAGDAAHIHSPLGGQGMNTGIQDAYNLAWKLALVINKKSPEKILASYHQERYPTVRQIVKTTDKLTKLLLVKKSMMSRLRNFLLRRVLNKRRVNNKIATQMSQIAIHYQNSDIINYSKHISNLSPKAGKSFPYILANVKPELIEILRTTQHIAFLFSGNTTDRNSLNLLDELYALFSEKYKGLITPYFVTPHAFNNQANNIIDSGLNIHKYFHAKTPAICIVRPDKYIAYASHTLDKEDITNYLQSIFFDNKTMSI